MTFQFRLEKILHFLRLKETMKKMEVVSVQKRIAFLEARRNFLQESIRGILSRQPMSYFHSTKVVLDAKEVQRLEARMEEEKAHLAKMKAELSRLMMRKKGLESLKEKKRQEFQVESNRRAQRQLDDLYSVRRKGEG